MKRIVCFLRKSVAGKLVLCLSLALVAIVPEIAVAQSAGTISVAAKKITVKGVVYDSAGEGELPYW